ncbi:hypothetical protein M8C21_028969, partial [Ambrosia artemisiifolia]
GVLAIHVCISNVVYVADALDLEIYWWSCGQETQLQMDDQKLNCGLLNGFLKFFIFGKLDELIHWESVLVVVTTLPAGLVGCLLKHLDSRKRHEKSHLGIKMLCLIAAMVEQRSIGRGNVGQMRLYLCHVSHTSVLLKHFRRAFECYSPDNEIAKGGVEWVVDEQHQQTGDQKGWRRGRAPPLVEELSSDAGRENRLLALLLHLSKLRILNKLTPEKFDILKGQLIDSGITTADILEGVISLIFDKAVLEPTFCPMYAQLCSDLNTKLPPFPSDEPDGKDITFKRFTADVCITRDEESKKIMIAKDP